MPESDVYIDQFSMAHSPFGVALTFGLSPNLPSPVQAQNQATTQAVVRMSLEHAKVMAMAIRKTLKQYELENLGDPIKLPLDLLQKMQLSEADW